MAASNIIVSIKPEYARNIIAGRKTVELRRRFADTSAVGRWMLIYSSSPEKAIIGAAKIKNVHRMMVEDLWETFREEACVTRSTFLNYFSGVTEGVGVMLGLATSFNMTIPVSELRERFSFHPPQSYRYVRGQLSQLLDDERVQIPDRYEHCDWSRRPSPSRHQTH
jgi:predicted transcriptional regulator